MLLAATSCVRLSARHVHSRHFLLGAVQIRAGSSGNDAGSNLGPPSSRKYQGAFVVEGQKRGTFNCQADVECDETLADEGEKLPIAEENQSVAEAAGSTSSIEERLQNRLIGKQSSARLEADKDETMFCEAQDRTEDKGAAYRNTPVQDHMDAFQTVEDLARSTLLRNSPLCTTVHPYTEARRRVSKLAHNAMKVYRRLRQTNRDANSKDVSNAIKKVMEYQQRKEVAEKGKS
eukprot:845385-Amphidinium_carterae.1